MSEELGAEEPEAVKDRIGELLCRADVEEMNGERLEDADVEGAAERGLRRSRELWMEADRLSRESGLGSIVDDKT